MENVLMPAPTTQEPISSEVSERFARLASDWKQKSRHLSNTVQMAMLKPYQQIIGMGEQALPLILEELRRERDHWFWALEAISGENPVEAGNAGQVKASAEAWIQWGIRKGYLHS